METSRIVVALAGLAAYLVLFSAGMLLDSKPYRDELSRWTPTAGFREVRAVEATVSFESVAVAQTEHQANEPAGAGAITPLQQVSAAAFAGAFFSAMCLFTPVNIALLALLAALLGGCASNLTYKGEVGLTERQAAFRSENPAASMIRGFLVYLGFIAGVYLATNSPFANVTADQYARLAGSISFLAFVVGYDPTKFQDFVSKSSIPGKP